MVTDGDGKRAMQTLENKGGTIRDDSAGDWWAQLERLEGE
jgi:hypothetical protein